VNSSEAKLILIACRTGTDDLRQPEARAALDLVQDDPALAAWWKQQQTFQERIKESFRQIPVPAHLHNQILARAKIIELPWWQRSMAIRAAAVVMLLAVAVVWLKPSPENSLPVFRSRMVRHVLREYSMEVVTTDMTRVRQYLAARSAPADFVLPKNLARLAVEGAGILSWQDRRVSMVCLDHGIQGTLFLFIVDGSTLHDPPLQPEYLKVSALMTVSWSEGGRTYVLAGHGAKNEFESFRP